MKPRVFRDPVHGLIGFQGEDAVLGGLIDTRAVQRLRRIRQLGFAWLVYPGAEHSRFGHALGTFDVAARVTARLEMPPDVARHVKVAALLHDLGHGPFSHAWEVALDGPDHEHWGRRIVAEDEELRRSLETVDPTLPDALGRLLAKRYTPRYAGKLISSQLDVDRMDYLLRDAHYSGVGYSAYDLDWVIHALRLAPVRDGGDPEDLVIDHRRGMNALEQYLFGRFYMYAQVYHHKTVRAAECMFLALMRRFAELARAGTPPAGLEPAARLARGEAISVEAYLGLDDARVECALSSWASEAVDPSLSDLAARLRARRLFKAVEIPDAAVVESLVPRFADAARRVFGESAASYWAIDRANWLGYDPRPGEELYVIGHPRHGTIDLGRLLPELPVGRADVAVRAICAPELREAFARIVAEAAPARP